MKYNHSYKKISMRFFATMLIAGFLSTSAVTSWASSIGDDSSKISETQQEFTVSGKITSTNDNLGLPGVNVVVKGTQIGVVSNFEGKYTIKVPSPNSTLVFSFIGFKVHEVVVNGKQIINVTLSENVETVDEVVVTALGISRKQKSLGYSVGTVGGEDLGGVSQENAISSLAGKVSGVQISSTGGTGSSVSMVIRGAKSLSNDNQPLFVIDGVPIVNSLNNITEIGSNNKVDYGNAISDLNSDDIESVSVLKGPSAAALYGSRAGNGVVLITTKSGKKNSGIQVNVTSSTVFDKPYKYYAVQKKFANGYFSYTPSDFADGYTMAVDPSITYGAGIELDKEYFAVQWDSPYDANGVQVPTELVSHPNNVANFVQTGITSTNGISVSNNNDKINYRIGFTNMTNKGVIPNSDLNRNNLTAATSIKVRNNLTLSSNININRSWSDNRPSSNRGTNPMQWAYNVPQNIDIRELRDYWESGKEGLQQRTTYNGVYNNPYFLANEVNNSYTRDRIFGNLKADWQINKEISLMGRYSLDQFSEKRETKIAPSYTGEPNNGAYGIQDITSYERNIDFLATYTKQFEKFNFSGSIGGNALYKKGTSVTNESTAGSGLIVPNLYTLSNIKSGYLSYASSWSQKAIYSIYGLVNLGWNDMVFLDLTARNDWSSTLPAENRSYFYPSASLSFLVNQILHLNKAISLLKVRGGWAQVGNDTDPYQLYNTYGNAGQWGDATRLTKSGQILTPNLKPEKETSKEFGVDLGLFGNRLRFNGTYYIVDNKNQIVKNIPVASSSGYTTTNINAGLIQSKGWELSLGGTPVNTKRWKWDVNINFTKNKTIVKEIADGVDVIEFWSDANGGAWSYVGDEIGTIYDATMNTVTDKSSPYYGYPILNSENEWDDIALSSNTKTKIGNFNPKFLMGFQTTISYKSFTLSMTVDWRCGGQFISQTERYMAEDSKSQTWLNKLINPGDRSGADLRDWLVENADKYIKNGFHVIGGPTVAYGGFSESYSGVAVHDGQFIPGVFKNSDGTYTENLGGSGTKIMPYATSYPWGFARPSMFDSDYVKLREISLSYNLPSSFLKKIGGIKNMALSLYSRNIILWTKAKIGIDPERAFQAESSTGDMRGTQFKQGIERYNLDPWVLPVGVKVDLTF